MTYERKMLDLIQKENAMLWSMLDTKNKVCSQLCDIIADLERKLRCADADQ